MGGLLAGGLGIAWLAASGGWETFLDIQVNWNGEYAAFAFSQVSRWRRFLTFLLDFLPWSLVLIPAVLMAVRLAPPRGAGTGRGEGTASLARTLLSAFFLAWLFQAALLQHPHYYVLMVSIIPAYALVVGELQPAQAPLRVGVTLVGFLLLAVLCSPLVRPEHLACWPSCFENGSTPALRARLTIEEPARCRTGKTSLEWRIFSATSMCGTAS